VYSSGSVPACYTVILSAYILVFVILVIHVISAKNTVISACYLSYIKFLFVLVQLGAAAVHA